MSTLQSGGDGVLADLAVRSLLLATDSHACLLEGRETTTERTVLLGSEVMGRVPLLFECSSSGVNTLLAEDSHRLGDVLPDLPDGGQLDLRLRRHLGHAELCESFLFSKNDKLS